MCEVIRIARIIVFIIVFLLTLIAVFNGMRFCTRKGIDFNTISGMLDMYSKMLRFEDKVFSVIMFLCMYGGALLMIIVIGISFWAEGKGCVFPTKYSK